MVDRSPRSANDPFESSDSQETTHVLYRNPRSGRSSSYGRSLSPPAGPNPTRSYGSTTPPLRPSSPSRHHRRTHSAPKPVKETLNAEFQEDDGVRRVNQYILKREIGRGSFGVVHLGVDSATGEEFAIKEFSKSKLRKRSQSMILRRTHSPGSANPSPRGYPAPSKRRSASDIHIEQELADSLYLVRGEIAIMKKLNHENVVKLIEVLDDPKGDSLYMVIEYCKHGPVMDIGLDRRAPPYPPEKARHLFRDLILGIEYLHAQGIVHRDIKPDNLLLDANDVLKIVDFGVSEMFSKDDDRLKSSNGSPAFASPELSQAGFHDVSGKAADIWAMGVTLYAFIYGVLPFRYYNVLELYQAIQEQEVMIPEGEDPRLVDLFHRILDKDPKTRIKMPELREHPWVTVDGQDPLLSTEENTAEMVTQVTEKDVAEAINAIRSVVNVVRAVNKLKFLRQNSKDHAQDAADVSSQSPSIHRHTKSLDIDQNSLHPHNGQIKKFPHDHVVALTSPDRLFSEPITDDEERAPMEPPLTPTIQVVSPPDELSEDEIQYIGVGLGALSTQDKRRRTLPSRASSEPPPILGYKASSESLRSDTSITSGQLTPAEPMVYSSPLTTHENLFEMAFQRAEDKIRLMEGEHTRLYDTWRSEESRGQPVSNRLGREKVELERIDDIDTRPRWERVLEEHLPHKLTDIYLKEEGVGKRRDTDGTVAVKLLGDKTLNRGESATSEKESESGVVESQEGGLLQSPTPARKRWKGLLGNTNVKQLKPGEGESRTQGL